MTHAVHRLSRLAEASALAVALAAPIGLSPIFATPAQAFLFGGGGRIVYDPRNHAENILSAARALEQINNQITQLQNEAQMLMNQARNLASLPYSSLQALQQNVDRTRQLLSQAQNIAFDVAQIDQVFQQDYANIPMAAPEAQLLADARSRWENTVGGLQDALRVQAGVVGNLMASAPSSPPLSAKASPPSARCRRPRPATSSWRSNPSRSPT
jgi:P-type conjugative transfer protein TrbJ